MLRFVIGGVQKAGTTALAQYLGRHPSLRLPRGKEAHVFDAPDFNDHASPHEVDARYRPLFDAGLPDTGPGTAMHGDATPFYLFQPRCIARIARYNPGMRWIVLLRDPVERALSHFHMEHARGNERWPLWAALLAERWRLRGQRDNFARNSPLRRHSYRGRGDYARQLDVLLAHFPREQVLLLRSEDLMRSPVATVGQACAFLQVPPPEDTGAHPPVFEGDYPRWPADDWRRRALRWWWRRELQAQQRFGLHWEGP